MTGDILRTLAHSIMIPRGSSENRNAFVATARVDDARLIPNARARHAPKDAADDIPRV